MPDQSSLDWFLSRDRLVEIDSMSPEELDELPFGAIRLAADGTILAYNVEEGRISGRNPDHVVGRNFFRDVAPCTNVREFAGRFREGVAGKRLHETFPYRFDFQMEPVDVLVTVTRRPGADDGWVFVRPRTSREEKV